MLDPHCKHNWLPHILVGQVRPTSYVCGFCGGTKPVPVPDISEAMVEAATREYLSHKGERPERILRGGYALWEASAEAMRAALEAALSAAPASAQMDELSRLREVERTAKEDILAVYDECASVAVPPAKTLVSQVQFYRRTIELLKLRRSVALRDALPAAGSETNG